MRDTIKVNYFSLILRRSSLRHFVAFSCCLLSNIPSKYAVTAAPINATPISNIISIKNSLTPACQDSNIPEKERYFEIMTLTIPINVPTHRKYLWRLTGAVTSSICSGFSRKYATSSSVTSLSFFLKRSFKKITSRSRFLFIFNSYFNNSKSLSTQVLLMYPSSGP